MWPLGDVLVFQTWFVEPNPWNQFHACCLQAESTDGNQSFLPRTRAVLPKQTAELLQISARGAAIVWAVQAVGEFSSHVDFQSHQLERLQAMPESAVHSCRG